MDSITRTGLIPSPRKRVFKIPPPAPISLYATSVPASFNLKPFAGLYNPYRGGSNSGRAFNNACSLLCNHPVTSVGNYHQNQEQITTRDLILMHLKRNKRGLSSSGEQDSWFGDWPMGGAANIACRTVLLSDEVSALKASLNKLGLNTSGINAYGLNVDTNLPIDSVPEELFRRYTQSDSRPLTPAPTLASCNTRRSGSRKCFTPEPIQTSEIREKTLLVLDLRRSHSQETISHFGSTHLLEPPLIRIHKVPTRTCSLENIVLTADSKRIKPKRSSQTSLGIVKGPVSKHENGESKKLLESPKVKSKSVVDVNKQVSDDDDDRIIKRRGRRRKRRNRNSSRGPPAIQVSIDPDTMVANIGPDSHNPSARPSLIANQIDGIPSNHMEHDTTTREDVIPDSFIDFDILKELRRELTDQIVDSEFNAQRRVALEEALKTVRKNKVDCEGVKILQMEIPILGLDVDNLMTMPRLFKRSNVRCELPMDSREFDELTPMKYIKEYISINSTKKLWYNIIFNRNKIQYDDDDEVKHDRRILGKVIAKAMGEMMGQALTQEHILYYQTLLDWKNDDTFDFKTFCSLCGLFERLMGKLFHEQMPDRSEDPVHEIECADFECLTRKIYGRKVDPKVLEIFTKLNEL